MFEALCNGLFSLILTRRFPFQFFCKQDRARLSLMARSRRAPGPNCSPSSSAARSFSTGLCPVAPVWPCLAPFNSTPLDFLTSLAPIGCRGADLEYLLAVWLLACWARSIVRAVLLVVGTIPSGAGLVWRGAVCWAILLIIAMLSGGVAGLYGGEANEVIRFMARQHGRLLDRGDSRLDRLHAAARNKRWNGSAALCSGALGSSCAVLSSSSSQQSVLPTTYARSSRRRTGWTKTTCCSNTPTTPVSKRPSGNRWRRPWAPCSLEDRGGPSTASGAPAVVSERRRFVLFVLTLLLLYPCFVRAVV